MVNKKGGNYKRHWSQLIKNKKGKTVTTGDHKMGKKLAKVKAKKAFTDAYNKAAAMVKKRKVLAA